MTGPSHSIGILVGSSGIFSCSVWAQELQCIGTITLWNKRFQFLHQGLNTHPLHCKVDSQPLDHHCSFIVKAEIKEPDSHTSIFLSEDCFGYLGLLHLHTNFKTFSSHSAKNAIILIGIALNLYTTLGSFQSKNMAYLSICLCHL